jgi:HSP20 family protein
MLVSQILGTNFDAVLGLGKQVDALLGEEVSAVEGLISQVVGGTTIFPSASSKKNHHRVPPVEINETEEAIYLKLEIPGVEPNNLDVEVTENSVSISGERTSNGMSSSEFYYGKFERVIPLTSKVKNNEVTAEYKDGILNLTLPKNQQESKKTVKVNVQQTTI